MWAAIIGIISSLIGFFFPKKDERDEERKAGEALGRAQAGQAAAEGELHDIAKASAARDAVTDDAASLLSDSNNAGPAKPV